MCNYCKKVGHFAKVCLKRKNVKKPVACVVESHNDIESEVISVIREDGEEETYITTSTFAVEGNLSDCRDPIVDIQVGEKSLPLLVDSGARITMITKKLFEETWGDSIVLSPPDHSPVSYEGRKIELLGFFEDKMYFKGRCIKGKIYVAIKGLNILGWFHQGLFGMVLKPGTQEQVLVVGSCVDVEQRWKTKYLTVFGECLGKVKGFKHKIVKQGAAPVKHKLRGVPFSIRSDLEKEPKGLCEKGIIEPAESSLWLSPLVVARKKDGKRRVCVDLRSLNKEIWVDTHPLPRISDLFAATMGAKVFSKLDLASAYHQVELHPDSKHLTAFISPLGTSSIVECLLG